MTNKELYEKAVCEARAAYIDELTDVVWLSLHDAGFSMLSRGAEWEKLREAISGLVK